MSPRTFATVSFMTGAILGFMPKFKALIALIEWDCLFSMYQVRRVAYTSLLITTSSDSMVEMSSSVSIVNFRGNSCPLT